MAFVINWILTTVAVAAATWLVPGLDAFGGSPWLCFLFVGLFLSLVNRGIKPLLKLISLPVTILTLGIFSLVINAFMLELASWLSVSILGAGISISSFWSAFFGAIIVSIVEAVLGSMAEE